MVEVERAFIKEIMKGVKDPVILNVGAYCGEDELEFLASVDPGENLLHIMVEPDPRNCAIIRGRPLNKNRRLIQGAVGSFPGEHDFYFSDDSRDGARGSGSIHTPTGCLTAFPTIAFTPGKVLVYTLDEIYNQEKLSKIDLLWVDVQGAERDLIASGYKALSHTHYCVMEAEVDEGGQLYENQASKQELISLMMHLRWAQVGDSGINIFMRNERFQWDS